MESREILRGIQYYQYHCIAGIAFVAYAVYHGLYGEPYVSAATAFSAFSIFLLVICRVMGRDSNYLQNLILVAMVGAVWSACLFLGLRGLLWLFPLVVGVYFNYDSRKAALISLVIIVGGLGLALFSVDLTLVLRVFLPLLFTVGYAYLYRTTIEADKRALEKEANEDYLTGVYNRRSFQRWLQRAIARLEHNESFIAVFYVDIDDFKMINDTYGHDVGDSILKQVGARLVESLRPSDAVAHDDKQLARIASDEFVIAATSLERAEDVDRIAQRLHAVLSSEITEARLVFQLKASIGIALCKLHDTDAETLLRQADAAMHSSKQAGKNRITYFDENIARLIAEKKQIALGIEEALREGAFHLNFMPIFALDDARETVLKGAEVLIRSRCAALDGFGPDQYIPVAEEYGSIYDIDLYVVTSALECMREVLADLPPDFRIAINISAKELGNDRFPEAVKAIALEKGIPFSMIELEITETSLVQHDAESIKMLEALKSFGFKLSLDDFGTGYTAFSQLQNYPVNTLKIDRSFVWNISDDNQDQELMVDVILSLAKLYDVEIVAEGVENQTQLDYLARSHCDFMQGYFLCKPLPWDDFKATYLGAVANDQDGSNDAAAPYSP